MLFAKREFLMGKSRVTVDQSRYREGGLLDVKFTTVDLNAVVSNQKSWMRWL
jgi:hypothetical protein